MAAYISDIQTFRSEANLFAGALAHSAKMFNTAAL